MRIGKIVLLSALIFQSCQESKESIIKNKVDKYFQAWNRHDFESPDFLKFKILTSLTWYGEKKGAGNLSSFNPNSGSVQWDNAWNGAYAFDIMKVDAEKMMVVGRYTETNDFYKSIGMPEGISATVTYWFDYQYRVKETLYNWDTDNPNMQEVLKPLVEWARVNDYETIYRLYLYSGLIPNAENAQDWKLLLEDYGNEVGGLN